MRVRKGGVPWGGMSENQLVTAKSNTEQRKRTLKNVNCKREMQSALLVICNKKPCFLSNIL